MSTNLLTFQGRKPRIPASCPLGCLIDAYLDRTYLSQSRLAQRIGVSQAVVSKWRRGQRVPSTRHIPPLAKALETSQLRVLRAIADGEIGP